MTEEILPVGQSNQVELPPIKLAFVIDGEVADILHTDERLRAIFLSNPKIIDISEKMLNGHIVGPGYVYDENTDTFSDPLEDEE